MRGRHGRETQGRAAEARALTSAMFSLPSMFLSNFLRKAFPSSIDICFPVFRVRMFKTSSCSSVPLLSVSNLMNASTIFCLSAKEVLSAMALRPAPLSKYITPEKCIMSSYRNVQPN